SAVSGSLASGQISVGIGCSRVSGESSRQPTDVIGRREWDRCHAVGMEVWLLALSSIMLLVTNNTTNSRGESLSSMTNPGSPVQIFLTTISNISWERRLLGKKSKNESDFSLPRYRKFRLRSILYRCSLISV